MTTINDLPAPPPHILILGAGVFGLSTTLSILSSPRYNNTRITILDASPILPNPTGSSVDSSRIIRADYAHFPSSKLALSAQRLWRDTSPSGWGGEGRYNETGFVLTADEGKDAYVQESLLNVRALAEREGEGMDPAKIQVLKDQEELKSVTGYPGTTGDFGYVNFNSGWADAGACVKYALKRIEAADTQGRVTIRSSAYVSHLIYVSTPSEEDGKVICTGAQLKSGEVITADLTVLATGAWTPTLIDLSKRCLATGQALTYITLTDEEQAQLNNLPVLMNLSRGMFIIPPRNCELKTARHGFGYRNPKEITMPTPVVGKDGKVVVEEKTLLVSVPEMPKDLPIEAHEACRDVMKEVLPSMAERPFVKTRVCWYCDTPTGDFLVTAHPLVTSTSLHIATGGSGHGFKFFPVIGDKILASIEGTLDEEYKTLWRWRENDDLVADAAAEHGHGNQHGTGTGPVVVDGETGQESHVASHPSVKDGYGEPVIETHANYNGDKTKTMDENTKQTVEGDFIGTDDGSRAGRKGMILHVELAKGR